MNTVSYLKDFILKDEVIDENEIYENEGLIYIPVKKRKQFVIYKTKMFVLSDKEPISIPDVFSKQWKRRTESDFRKLLNIASEVQFQQKIVNLIKEGLIVKVIEYRSRGIEIRKRYFIPSYTLQILWIDKDEEKLEKDIIINEKYKDRVKNLKNPYNHVAFDTLLFKTLDKEFILSCNFSFSKTQSGMAVSKNLYTFCSLS